MKERLEQAKDKTVVIAKSVWKWLVRYPIALIVAVGVLLFAVILLMLGMGDRFNIGGIIGKLFGAEEKDSDVKMANEVPSDRVGPEGDPIEKGEPDEHGWVQHEVKPLDRSSNPFRDKSKVVIEDEDGTQRKIKLPTGVEDTDVETVIEMKPKQFEIVVKSGPKKIDQNLIDDLRG